MKYLHFNINYDTYYIEKVDNNKFPDNIKFPLTEEEAKNAMELKKTMDLKQETEN